MGKVHWRMGGVVLAGGIATTALAMPSFGDWSTPASLESIPGSSSSVNTANIEGCASITPDGLTRGFNSFRSGNQQLYIARRASTDVGFGDPEILPATLNTSAQEFCPTMTHGNRMYFTRSGPGDPGDLFVTKLGPKGWQEPQRLGTAINNTGTVEESVSLYEDDEGREVMLFSRRPAGAFDGIGGKIYQSVAGAPASLLAGGPHSNSSDNRPSVTHDGKTIFWDSMRTGTLGGPDLYYATRSNVSHSFGDAVHLSALSSAQSDSRAVVTWKGTMLTFSSARPSGEGMGDMFFTTRSKD